MNKANEKLYPIKIDGINSIQDRAYYHDHILKAIDILTDSMKNNHRLEYLEAIYYLNQLQVPFSPHGEDKSEIFLDDVECPWHFELYNIGLTKAINLVIGTNLLDRKEDYDVVYCLSKLNKALTFTWGHVRNQRKMGVA